MKTQVSSLILILFLLNISAGFALTVKKNYLLSNNLTDAIVSNNISGLEDVLTGDITSVNKYQPGTTIDFPIITNWFDLDIMNIIITFPQGVTINSCPDVSIGFNKVIHGYIDGNTLTLKIGDASYQRMKTYFCPVSFNPNLTFDSEISGNLEATFIMNGCEINGSPVFESSFVIPIMPENAITEPICTQWDAGVQPAGIPVVSKVIILKNGGEQPLELQSVSGLDDSPFSLNTQLPYSIPSMKVDTLEFVLNGNISGYFSCNPVIQTNDVPLNISLTCAVFGAGYNRYDFENLMLPNGWESTSLSDFVWHPVLYNGSNCLKFASNDAPEGTQAQLLLPLVDMSTIEQGRFFSFKLKHDNVYVDENVDVFYSSDLGVTWHELLMDANGFDNMSFFREHIVLLDQFAGFDFVQFKLVGNASGQYAMYIDDITMADYYIGTEIPEAANNPTPQNGATNVMNNVLSWDASINATGYKVSVGTSYPPANEIDLGNVTSFQYDLMQGTQYFWQVVPYNSNGNAENCPVWSFTSSTYEPTQWNSNVEENLFMGSQGEQLLPLIAVAPDGDYYLAWFESYATQYRVMMQHLSATGESLWDEGGILISDHPQNSWLADWDLQVDSQGNAIIAFPDKRTGNLTMNGYKISPEGDFVWGPDGVNLSGNNAIEEYTPRIAVLDNDDVVFVWNRLVISDLNQSCVSAIQCVRSNGVLVWNNPYIGQGNRPTVFPVSNNEFLFTESNLQNVTVVRMDTTKNVIWNTTVDLKTTEYAHIDAIKTNADALAISSSYSIGSELFVNAAFISSEGECKWVKSAPENLSFMQTMPKIGYLENSDEVAMFWHELNFMQDEVGLRAQLYKAQTGDEQWGESGKVIFPLGNAFNKLISCRVTDSTIVAFFSEKVDEFGFKTVTKALALNKQGASVWSPEITDICTCQNNREKETVTALKNNQWVMAWTENRDSNINSIYLQNCLTNGEVGVFIDSDAPEVLNIDFNSDIQLTVLFNEDVEHNSAETIENYQIDGVLITDAQRVNSNMVVLTLENIQTGNYSLVINNVEDLWGNAMNDYSIAFDYVEDIEAPEVLSSAFISNNTLSIIFNELLDEYSATNLENYSLASLSKEISIDDVTLINNKVLLNISGISDGDYLLSIDGVKDLRNNAINDFSCEVSYLMNTTVEEYYYEPFNQGIPSDISLVDVDQNVPVIPEFTNAWISWNIDDGFAAASTSKYDPADYANDWMVTPAIAVQYGAYLSWDVKSLSFIAPDGYEVLLSTTGTELTDFNTIVYSTNNANPEWSTKTVDLTSLGISNQIIYLAFRNTTYNGYVLLIDNIRVFSPVSRDASIAEVNYVEQVTPGSQLDIEGRICNLGTDLINSIRINWSLNGDEVNFYDINDANIDINQEFSFFADQTLLLETTGVNILKYWVSNINGQEDMNHINDTLTVDFEVIAGAAQRLVMLEHYTNYACGPCAQYNPVLEELLLKNQNNEKVAHLSYHVNWPGANDPMYLFNSMAANGRIAYYGINGVPDVLVDGNLFHVSPQDVTQSMLNNAYIRAGLLNVEGFGKIDGNDLSIACNLTPIVNLEGNIVAQVVLTEDIELLNAPNGETNFPSVMREMFPSHNGSSLSSLQNGETTQLVFDYSIPSDIDVSKTHLFVLVQNNDNHQILMTAELELKDVTGVQNQMVDGLVIYPNPARDHVTLKNIANANVEIFNATGGRVFGQQNCQHNVNVNLNNFDCGMYIVRCIYANGVVSQSRFICY